MNISKLSLFSLAQYTRYMKKQQRKKVACKIQNKFIIKRKKIEQKFQFM